MDDAALSRNAVAGPQGVEGKLSESIKVTKPVVPGVKLMCLSPVAFSTGSGLSHAGAGPDAEETEST